MYRFFQKLITLTFNLTFEDRMTKFVIFRVTKFESRTKLVNQFEGCVSD